MVTTTSCRKIRVLCNVGRYGSIMLIGVCWLTIVNTSSASASLSKGSLYEKFSDQAANSCADGAPSQTVFGSKVFCSSACNRLPGCEWFNFIDSGVSSPLQMSHTGKCQLFAYQPGVVSNINGCTLWQKVPVNPVLVQQHFDGSTTFNRGWTDYKTGFGDELGDYWIGNEQLHFLSASGRYKVRFDLQAKNDSQWYWAEYSTFSVDNEANSYKMTISGYTGNAGNSLAYHSGFAFATQDRPDPYGCANGLFGNNGGYWYNHCSYANINGSPSLFSNNGIESFLWQDLPVGATRGDRKLLASRMWLVLL